LSPEAQAFDALHQEQVDNRTPATTHREVLRAVAADVGEDVELSIATGFVNIGGLEFLASGVSDGRRTRIMLGAEPPQGLDGAPIKDLFAAQLSALGRQRDLSRFPPSRAFQRLGTISNWLEREDVEVRRFETSFLHGKAYIFGTAEQTKHVTVTSANLTHAGLNKNLELGAARRDHGPVRSAIKWFDALWDDAVDYKPDLQTLLFPDIGIVEPRWVYLRALAEHFGSQPDEEAGRHEIYSTLIDFQRNGYKRARSILDEHGGVIYADGVGTGKTEIGLSMVEHYSYDKGHHALIVAPAQLKENWTKRVHRAKLPAQVVSFNELVSDRQLRDDGDGREVLKVNKDAYRLIVIDEAHALRNPDTTWHRAVARLAGGTEKHLLLLTATPINNSLADLHHLVMLFARHDRAFAADGIPSLRELFKQAGANQRDPEQIDPDKLFDLIELTVVRRDRTFIEKHYKNAQFGDGTPVKFPTPVLSTPRYSIDDAHPGVVRAVALAINGLQLARYMPSRYLLNPEDAHMANAEVQLAGLLRSGVLKRFESCWQSCLITVKRMIAAHDQFLKLWDEEGVALFGDALTEAAKSEQDSASLAAVLEDLLEDEGKAFKGSDFKPEYRAVVAADRQRLVVIRDQLVEITPEADPKLALLRKLISESTAQKIAVFSTFADTIRYLDEHLGLDDRERVVVLGSDASPDERTKALSRFAPKSVVDEDFVPADGEVDLLLATDVLSEGQNLQQADCVISYDMPWNPQRVVQRNGRVIRLLSPHDEVYLVTMLPERGDLEALLELESRIRAKVKAAAAIGMESEVIADDSNADELAEIKEGLEDFVASLDGAAGEVVANDADPYSGAFLGEEIRAMLEAAMVAGDLSRVTSFPWGIGAATAVEAEGRQRTPGVFFAARTVPMEEDPDGHKYWRYVEFADGEFSNDVIGDRDRLELLRRIDPSELEVVEEPDADQLDAAWQIAAADIVRAHNARLAAQALQISVGPVQAWARKQLASDQISESLILAADNAYEALAVERSMAVRKELKAVRADHELTLIGDSEAIQRIVTIIEKYSLRPVNTHEADVSRAITEDDLGVVCWMSVGVSQQ
jgi:superfamily II DNA or RNA helicase